ncbi:MAG: gluconate 2-dehydrogenase subunit 3 family protein [Chitinophagales bacterium]
MDRRELLKLIALATGTAFVGGEFFLSGCTNPEAGPSVEFSQDDVAYLDEVGETILPKTNSPGAKEAKIGAFMTIMVNDCYSAADQKAFHAGLQQLNDECKKMHDVTFMKATPEQRKSLLIKLDGDAKEYAKKKPDFDAQQVKKQKEEHEKGNTGFEKERWTAHYFSMMKQLTISGYYTSKEGRMGSMRYTPVPGKYDGDLNYKKGDKAFAGLD